MALEDEVAAWRGDSTVTPAVATAAAAVNAWLARMRPDLDLGDPADASSAPDDVTLGCVMLVDRLIARKGTPVGQQPGYDGAGVGILSQDPDVQRLTGTGRSRKPGGVG